MHGFAQSVAVTVLATLVKSTSVNLLRVSVMTCAFIYPKLPLFLRFFVSFLSLISLFSAASQSHPKCVASKAVFQQRERCKVGIPFPEQQHELLLLILSLLAVGLYFAVTDCCPH